LLMLA